MAQYKVVWEIDIDAESPEMAARLARTIQLDPDNTATHFVVTRQEVVFKPEHVTSVELEDEE